MYKDKNLIAKFCAGFVQEVGRSLIFFCGRGERIRTSDILLPKQARYQAALRPANKKKINITSD